METVKTKTYKPFYWLTEESQIFLSRGYLQEGEDAKNRIRAIANRAEEILKIEGFSEKFYTYMSKGYYSLSTPVWTNFGTNRGFPISCFGSTPADNMASILSTASEVGMMSKYGGGTSGYFGHLRPRGADITNNGQSSGAVHFVKLFEQMTDTVSQGSSRRGRFAAYLPIDHPDIDEFLEIGVEGNDIQDVNHAVTVTDAWMTEMIAGDQQKRKVWAKVLQRRVEMGYPYIFFTDTVNNNKPEWYKDDPITHSNLCSEIALPDNEKWSFVCNLSSMNALHYDEWKDTDAVQTMIYFLDAVMSEFIEKLEAMRDSEDAEYRDAFHFMERAYNFATENRALGLGVLGWHSLLQSKMIAFESVEASLLNEEIHKVISERAKEASQELADLFGEPEVLKGTGFRNATTMAIAPTTSSAFIIGQVSQSIEPLFSNYYVKDMSKIKTTIKNKYLEDLLVEKGQNTAKVWDDIKNHDGSVQHLDFLSEHEKNVFKTFAEINQYEIINQASVRQRFIDQSQSLNIMINPSMTTAKEINQLHLYAWENGIKSLYYQHSTSAAQQFYRSSVCLACEA
ncbi:MAG TPA: ribonucleoside-diphosphate reductase subunit alpha [Atopostipes sp.]|nr:ribonucleoside-diphosphate reductase subunit alpha [Atopostipes sp.]